MIELIRALAVFAEPPEPPHRRLGELLGLPVAPDPSEHTAVFGFQLCPYASVYLGADGMLGGEPRDRIAGFWRALRLAPPAEPDHLSALLGLYATLAEREEREEDAARRVMWRHSRSALLSEHLACWLFPYLDALDRLPATGYQAWGRLLGAAMTREAATLPGPDGLPRHLHAAPGLPDPRREGGEAFLRALLAPVRSGVILTRVDLARAAGDLGLGLRMGERRFILASLLGQDAAATLAWLAGHARAASARYEESTGMSRDVREFWAGRAAATARLLDAVRPAEVPA